MTQEPKQIAINDIKRSLSDISLAGFLAWEDIRQRYVRTMFGPLWIVLSTGVWAMVMGFVMANLFGQDMNTYLPFMMSGLLTWVLISSSILEASTILVYCSALVNSFSIPIFTHYIRFILRNMMIFGHNLIILAIVLLIYPPNITMATWLVIPGLLINMIILMSLGVLLSLSNLRYRDTHMAVSSGMQVLPFVTPIFWDRGMLKNHPWIADINPFYHMINIVRSPVLGETGSLMSWCIAIGMAVGLFGIACKLFIRYRHRIIFWL